MNAEFSQRLMALESRLSNEERAKGELREKLILSEQNFKQISNFIQTFQQLDSTELKDMRAIIQDKITEDQQLFLKEREKSKALFNELVRLGETQESNSKELHTTNLELQQRLQQLESRYVRNEQELNQVQQKGETGINYVSEWNEKLDGRIQQIESNLIGLGKEQLKDRDSISRIEVLNQKITENLKDLLGSMQNDFDGKLETRVSDLVNRIVLEHEERLRAQEDVKSQVEQKTKLQDEKMKYEKEEMRDRYMAMDSLVRAEFLRKEESIRALHDLMETNFRSLQKEIKEEEITRQQFEGALRVELEKMQQVMNKDMEFFKSQFALENEKLTEIVKGEIETRFSSDV